MPRVPTPPSTPFARLVDGVLEKVMVAAIIWGATRASAIVQSITELKTEVEKIGYVLHTISEHDIDQDAKLDALHVKMEKWETRRLPVK